MNNLTLNTTNSKSIILLAIKDSDTTWVLVSACLVFLMVNMKKIEFSYIRYI
jgi:hypothetical protein